MQQATPAPPGSTPPMHIQNRQPARQPCTHRIARQHATSAPTIPPGSTGTVYVPAKNTGDVRVNGAPVSKGTLVRLIKFADGRAAYAVASGSYTFTSSVE